MQRSSRNVGVKNCAALTAATSSLESITFREQIETGSTWDGKRATPPVRDVTQLFFIFNKPHLTSLTDVFVVVLSFAFKQQPPVWWRKAISL